MATTIACLRSKMGSTEYYVATMKVGELIRSVGFAENLPDWKDMDIEERMQRELDKSRVAKDIVPYLQTDPNHFFGSLIIDIYGGWEDLSFEPLKEVVTRLPKAYEQSMKNSAELGFLHLAGNERLIALDGQHRLLALKKAVEGDEKYEIEPEGSLLNDDITVIFLPHGPDARKIRSIFNKVNRYAKSTSRGDNIITSEDDPFAILSRRLIKAGEPLPEELVNWTSNTLSPTSSKFTTLSAIYESLEIILEEERPDKKRRPADAELDIYYRKVKKVWLALLEHINVYAKMLHNPEIIRKERQNSLLFKPVGQVAVIMGLNLALKAADLDLEEGVKRLNLIDWSLSAVHWENIIVNTSGTVIATSDAKRLTARLIAWMMVGDAMKEAFKSKLVDDFSRAKVGKEGDKLPLPTPINVVPIV